MIDTTPHIITALLAMGMALAFIIADRNEAFVLETIGRRWAVEKAGPTRAISNTYTINTNITAASPDLEAFARALYGYLHQCDDRGAALVVIEQLPPGSAWDGIRDRLQRASASDGRSSAR